MKRAAACLLALCLILQGPASLMTSFADFGQRGVASPSNSVSASPSSAWKENESEGKNGELKVEIRGVLPVQRAAEWELFLTKDEELSDQGTLQFEAVESAGVYSSGSYTFTDLPRGKYQLLVKSLNGGYEDYIQKNISINGDRASILLLNDYPEKYGYTGNKMPGVIRMGDVNGDGQIDGEDMEELIDAIDEAESNSTDSRCDFNGDGEVDLVDLQYFTIFYKNKSNTKATVTSQALVNPDAVTASSSNAVFSVDTLKEVFAGNSSEALKLETAEETAITPETPVEVSAEIEQGLTAAGFTIQPVIGSGNTIRDGFVTVECEGEDDPVVFKIENGVAVRQTGAKARAAFRSASPRSGAEDSAAGRTIVIDLGRQVAIKKVTITVTAALEKEATLVEISKVEFLNNMENRIPEPEMNIPENLNAVAGRESFDLTWKRAVNVTGYEAEVTGRVKSGIKTAVIPVSENRLSVESIQNEDLINGEDYTVRVQSVNGAWKSGYSESVKVTPEASKRPDPPEGITVKGGYRSLDVSWKKMKDTDSYSLFYREYDDADGSYIRIDNIENTTQTIPNLKDETKYDIYLTGTNKIGESAPSMHYSGTTESVNAPVTPNYKLINVAGENGGTEHIKAVNNHGGTADSEFAVADNDAVSAWVRNDWDAGCVYPGESKSPTVTLDDSYTMDTVVIIPDQAQKFAYTDATFFYWPEGKNSQVQAAGTFSRKTSSNGKTYYEFQTSQPVTTDRVQVRLTTGYGPSSRISIAEMKFYYYDPIEHEVYDLFADDMHLSLKEGVTQESIDSLRARLEVKDEVSGELHPKKEILERELTTAEQILKDEALADILTIDNRVTKKADGSITFGGGLNAWQPLGVTAMAGDTVMVYVGSPEKKTGDSTNLRLIATQYHGESSAWSKTIGMLKAGINEITIPKITDLDVEQGGQLYVEYTGAQGKERYSVRVSGGHQIPTLNVTMASDSNAARALVTKYVEELEATAANLETEHENHKKAHDGDWSSAKKNCILGATDIVTKYMMFSVSSQQILAGLSGGTVEEKAEQLYQSLTAADEMVNLFYQHKGLSSDPDAGEKNKLPVSRLNLRYQRMFAGAFMYAGGLHIGIEWGSIPGLTRGVPVKADPKGRYESGQYFGWGIAHEIGHEINEGAYAIAEITNNYFSVLAQAHDTNDSVRFQYPEVYKKVTSGVTGRSSNVFTQLGLYWQLHLAYDMGGYNYKTYDKYRDQFNNLFFARVDSYVRNTEAAPKPGGVSLSLSGDVDNKLMRLACAAAEKNILEFFERWGMVPDETTKKYAQQFEKETRAIWFVNDEARAYVLKNGKDGSVAASTVVEADLSYTENSNEVTIHLASQSKKPEAMLGYEIYRSETIKSHVEKKPVGFVTADQTEFVDSVSTVNNRVFTYEVVGYDKYLNATKPVVLEPVKVSHGGVIDKSDWTVTTNMVSAEDKVDEEINPDTVTMEAIGKVIDNDAGTTYTGKTVAGSNGKAPAASVTIHLNREETITGLTYKLSNADNAAGSPIGNFKVEISDTGADGSWTQVKAGTFSVAQGQLVNGSETVYFNKNDDTWLYAYDTSYIRITAVDQKGTDISISEIDLLGQTGDDIDFGQTDSIGILKEDYHAGHGESGEAVIPKGSLIFTGTYKGNPAYNVVLLYDEQGKIVGGTDEAGNISAAQMIFAEVPEHGELGETSSGTWIYYIEPGNFKKDALPKRVRAELYRVDNAHDNRGERLVSNTLFVDMPEKLPVIEIKAQD